MVAGFKAALLFFSLSLCLAVPTEGTRVPQKSFASHFGSQGVNLWKLQNERARSASSNADGAQRALGSAKKLPRAQYFEQPLDHFNESVNKTFRQR